MTVRRRPDRADIDAAVRSLGRHIDIALMRCHEQATPEQATGPRRERECRGIGRPVHTTTVDDHAVRAGIRVGESMPPAQRPRLQIEREDVALHVLYEHDACGHHGRRREDAGVPWRSAEAEAPRDVERADVLAVDAARWIEARR
jgi:hypothetical protein